MGAAPVKVVPHRSCSRKILNDLTRFWYSRLKKSAQKAPVARKILKNEPFSCWWRPRRAETHHKHVHFHAFPRMRGKNCLRRASSAVSGGGGSKTSFRPFLIVDSLRNSSAASSATHSGFPGKAWETRSFKT